MTEHTPVTAETMGHVPPPIDLEILPWVIRITSSRVRNPRTMAEINTTSVVEIEEEPAEEDEEALSIVLSTAQIPHTHKHALHIQLLLPRHRPSLLHQIRSKN